MKKSLLLLMGILCISVLTQAQTQVNFKINHKLGANAFAMNQTVQNNLNQDFNVTQLLYFVSGITIIHDGGMQTPVTNKYIYVNGNTAVNENLGTFNNITNVEGIKFHIGVDSPANNTDPTTYSAGDPLAPKNPVMWWGWAAGRRFVRMHGNTGSGMTNNYQLHPLWNHNYYEQTHMTAGFVNGNTVDISLDADYTQALKDINITAAPTRHGDDLEDLDMLKNFRDFVFSPATSVGVNDFSKELALNIYPNPSNGQVHLTFKNDKYEVTQVKVLDVSGKTVQQINAGGEQLLKIDISTKGIYFLELFDGATQLTNKKLIIQ